MVQKILILIHCADRVGLVSVISEIIAGHHLNIDVMREFVDQDSAQFFTRIECSGTDTNPEELRHVFLRNLGAEALVKVQPTRVDKRIAVLVTKEYHCLGDILVKNFFKTLGAEVCCVVGNHRVLEKFVNNFGIPFHYVDHEGKSKPQFEEEMIRFIDPYQPDYLCLAKFMRILSPEFVDHYTHRILNIHHSFLPAFIGAKPYHQAFDRGVKMIGATAHIVTDSLDDGPIIAQRTIQVNHNYNAAQMRTAGREVERSVLGKALTLLLEDRIFITGNKTVIFE